ncbi:hypothetical protein Vafri_14510 [Volvox africanus]|uniref:Uncharacterized protein n=1 Tax=Volvox africanus TaxID=51714 RepID=A0A8J4BEK2_9CHLO|nr:hypothetical protein Vafri_14510 [Volvox africanus]
MSRHNGSLVSGWNGWRFETHEPLYEAEDEGRMTERRRLLTIAMDWYTVAQCSGALPRRDDLNSSLWELPSDIREVTKEHLKAAGAQPGVVWLTAAFWDTESTPVVPDVLRVFGEITQLVASPKSVCLLGHPARPPGADSAEEMVEAQVDIIVLGTIVFSCNSHGGSLLVALLWRWWLMSLLRLFLLPPLGERLGSVNAGGPVFVVLGPVNWCPRKNGSRNWVTWTRKLGPE